MTPEVINKGSEDIILSFEHHFTQFETQAQEWMDKANLISVTDINQVAEMKQAREARLELRKIRINVDKKHEELKKDILIKGQSLDLIKRKLTSLIEPIEEVLLEKEKFAEVQGQKRKDALYSTRIQILAPLIGAQANAFPLGEMDEEVFQSMVNGYKLVADKKIADEKAKLDADKKAEEDRLAENNRLKEIADHRDRFRIRVQSLSYLGLRNVDDTLEIDDMKNNSIISCRLHDVEHWNDIQFAGMLNDLDKIFQSNQQIKKKQDDKRKKEEDDRKAKAAPLRLPLPAGRAARARGKRGGLSSRDLR